MKRFSPITAKTRRNGAISNKVIPSSNSLISYIIIIEYSKSVNQLFTNNNIMYKSIINSVCISFH